MYVYVFVGVCILFAIYYYVYYIIITQIIIMCIVFIIDLKLEYLVRINDATGTLGH